MADLKFSVVIPTRERAGTLHYSLRTCLDQNFDDYEVIVSDNFSSPATRAVVDEAASSKVRYFRTPSPLAMASNWEFGVSQARGEYVLLIGDDDGLLPHALETLDALIRRERPKAIRWDAVFYTWPTYTLPGQENYLRIPMGRRIQEVDSFRTIREVIAFRELYTVLPMLYNSAVHRDVLKTMRAKTGRVFPHSIPDVYSGFAIAAVAGKYLSTEVPLSISGQSAASNGIAVLFQRSQSKIAREFQEFNTRDGLLPDPRIPDLPVFPHVPVADAFLVAKKQFFANSKIEMDRKQVIAGCVENLRVATEEEWKWGLGLLRESLKDEPELQTWFDLELAKTPFRIIPTKMKPDRLGFDGSYLHLDATRFGAADVAGASELCERVLSYDRDGVEFVRDETTRLWRIARLVKRTVHEAMGWAKPVIR